MKKVEETPPVIIQETEGFPCKENPFGNDEAPDHGDGTTAIESKSVPRWNKKQQYIVDSESFTSVKSLSVTSSTDWVIKVKVVKKYEKRSWNNMRGQGLLMNVDL